MNKPTDKQIKKLWEWCGFKHGVPFPELAKRKDIPHPERFLKEQWYIHKGFANTEYPYCGSEPIVDLNNLFKYAVPKVRYFSMFYDSKLKFLVSVDGGEETGVATAEGNDPALALFWSIQEVINE